MTVRRLAAVLAADVVGFSALMEQDELETLQRIKSLQHHTIEPRLLSSGGRLVKTTGDGFLIEFGSPSEALQCAIEIQASAAQIAPAKGGPLSLRIGINLGEILVEDNGDIFGDDVNIAARLQALADPGGILLSGKVYDEVEDKEICLFKDRGKQSVKNISRPIRIYAVAGKGAAAQPKSVELARRKQEIHFCRSIDGVRLAWATVGSGPPIVKTGNFLNHLDHDWQTPIWRHLFDGLANKRTLIRYDSRGNGLSDWDVPEISLDTFVIDLETVVEAAGIGRFPLLGISQGAAIAISYAVRHPDRVSHLILYGGYALGARKRSPLQKNKREALAALMRVGWEDHDSTVRDVFASFLIPDGTPQQRSLLADQYRTMTTGECAARYFETAGNFDVVELLPKVQVPTLAMHSRGDLLNPLEAGRQMAEAIPRARFVVLPRRNHVLPDEDPAAKRFFEEVEIFLTGSS